MGYKLAIEEQSGYLYIRVTGENGRETVLQYLAEIVQECQRRDCFRVLIEDRLSGPRLPVMDVYEIASEGSMRAPGLFDAIAYVDVAMGEMGEFAETVAVNRGMPVAIFFSLEDARSWLSNHMAGSDDQQIFTDNDRS